MFRTFTRITTPVVAGVVAFGVFPFRKSQFDTHESKSNQQILDTIKQLPLYNSLVQDPTFTLQDPRKQFPKQHHQNMVTAGILYGKDLFEVDPVVFSNGKGDLFAFNYLGEKLTSEDGQIHNGVTSTMLDEGLCMAGFPLLPSKKGVTAKLSINFQNQAPPNSIVLLKAHVTEQKGRKAVVEGSIVTVDQKPVTIATATCIVVEPKWFKYLSWLSFI
ncbi:thioesterase superfamily protein [Yamadazyma tenuis]|uniref:Thioesterase domain-containing protein n=1 Tax=Candida tenuis (strain ATCC 10573 / BCRC 21748 / CBS 615 / JCM 9827 / NBRC 10315 / NRRL Y-1498 / VKM Y-70) TaxID=590646 RepID=G3B0C2_CANTC|nr:uncharacterized protein CANTEDRAFT_102698 [Yamadazyma tenuis ATCC 10573]EGV65366.1 hypothetical protein CANTEDRAFT_102698 [Yamadazyma tenuis ATCC 10573]WEJ94971.1 thioesterase superfamily protein [Yamadazyma tenuis]